MTKILILTVLLASTNLFAADYSLFYSDASGKKIEMVTALTEAMQGKPVFKCQSVEAKPSKSGNSLSLHNIKKPKKD